MPTRITGLGSGLDIETLVQQQMQAKRIPIDLKRQKLTSLSWQRDAYREVNTQVSAFLNEVRNLRLESTFLAKKASMSTDDSQKVTVKPTSGSLNGNFTLEVKQLAKNATLISKDKLGIAGDTKQAVTAVQEELTISGELGEKKITIMAGDNISQIVGRINAETSSTGVKAVYDQFSDKLTFVSTQTGELSTVQVKGSSAFLDKLQLEQAAGPGDTGVIKGVDAEVNFNGNGWAKVRSNSFTMNNINFTLLKDPGATPYTINASVNSDVDKVVDSVKSFVTKYNDLIKNLNDKITEKKYRDYKPLTENQKKDMKEKDIELWEEKAKSGLLAGDSIIRGGLDRMRRALSDNLSGLPDGVIKSLADIGITTKPSDGTNTGAYKEQGKLYLDEDKLRQALTDYPDQVNNLFTKEGARDDKGRLINPSQAGIGTRLFDIVNMEIISGISEKTQTVPTQSPLNQLIDDYTKKIAREESELSKYEQKLYSQYARLEQALNKFNSQGSYLSSFFQKG
ncbi:flagellar filament capping protein FliD [Brevibacillus borstelensis]|uniref:flagellar filament capping protein FliD n=1 Tax=Brevibacillus borstelensis TaxID=45462 RepID=UPI002E1E6E1C|nr:flagellar filament capping protein FliD [Brevibacillus borstelensis]MED1872998.1 flagellar filament capping protein FliD [Brevibacillus borstelensis]